MHVTCRNSCSVPIALVAYKVQMFVFQGVEFSVFIHESRALTESKESQASLAYFEQDVT